MTLNRVNTTEKWLLRLYFMWSVLTNWVLTRSRLIVLQAKAASGGLSGCFQIFAKLKSISIKCWCRAVPSAVAASHFVPVPSAVAASHFAPLPSAMAASHFVSAPSAVAASHFVPVPSTVAANNFVPGPSTVAANHFVPAPSAVAANHFVPVPSK